MRRLTPLLPPATVAVALFAAALGLPRMMGAAPTSRALAQSALPAGEPTPLPESYGLAATWRTNTPTGSFLFHPQGLAADRYGVVVVVEAGNHRLTRASARGDGPGIVPDQPRQRFGQFGAGPGQLDSPEDVAVSDKGERIYVADTGNRRVQVFNPAGQVLGAWPDVGLPRGIAVGPGPDAGGATVPDGRVYVSDAAGRRVRVYAADGTWQADWDAGGSLTTPLGLSVTPTGDLVVADHGAQRILWLDADGSAGPAGTVVGTLLLDNSAGPGGAPTDVGVDVNGDVFVSVARGILRFRNTTPGTLGPVPPGSGVAANLGFAASWPALRERPSAACAARGCGLAGPGCAVTELEREVHEGVGRLDLRPDAGLYFSFAPGLRWLDRVVVYPAQRNKAGISPPEYGEGWLWPRLCEDYSSAEYRHATDVERVAAGADPYAGVGLDTAGWLRTWRANGAWQDGLHVMKARGGRDLAVLRQSPSIAAVITGNQVTVHGIACLLGFTNTPFPIDTCRSGPLNMLDRGQLIRRERTNECRRALPIPWRAGDGGPCIPDDTWWHTAVGFGGNAAALDTGNRRIVIRTSRGELVAGPALGAPADPFRAFVDVDYDIGGQLWALAADGAVRLFDAVGRDRGEMALVGPAAGKAESLSVADDGSFFVLTGDGWVVKYAPDIAPPPTATATSTPRFTPSPGPSPRPTRTLSRPTSTARPTLSARALPLAAWKVADHAGPGRYRDLAVGSDGRVLVPDADHDRMLVFAPAPSQATPVPTSPPELGPCRFTPEKVANPTTLQLGELTEVTLRLGGDCGSRHNALDVMVVVDASCQMSGDRLKRTREALVALVDAMTLPDDRLGIATFVEGAGDARVLVPLTGDRERLREAGRAFDTDCRIMQLCLDLNFRQKAHVRSFLFPYGCVTEGRISDGLRAGREALFGPAARPEAGKALILLSPSRSDSFRTLYTLSQDPDTFDPPMSPSELQRWIHEDLPRGVIGPVGDRDHALWEAWQLRESGVRVLTTGVGMDSFGAGHPPDQGLLAALAWPADGYRPAGAPADLVPVLAAEGRELSARVLMQQLVITDRIPVNMRLVPGSVAPLAEVLPENGRPDALLRWRFAEVALGGLPALRYRLEPLEVGRWPTNVEAFGDYVDGLDQAGRSSFPVPEVNVLGVQTPTDEPTPLPPTPTATELPTETPGPTSTPTATASRPPTDTASPSATPSRSPTPRPTARLESRRIYLPLVERWRCQPSAVPVDVVLAIDTSSSMTGPKLAAAKQAAAIFVNLLDLRPGRDRAAVVGFNTTATLAQTLTANRSAVLAGLSGLDTAPGTRIDLGLGLATAELSGSRRRADADRVIVLLTDGLPQAGSEGASVTAGAQARALGTGLWGIGLGSDAAPATLAQITGAADRVLIAPSLDDLEGVYRRVASGIICR